MLGGKGPWRENFGQYLYSVNVMVHNDSLYKKTILSPLQTWEIYLYLTYRFRGANSSLKIPVTVSFSKMLSFLLKLSLFLKL